MTLEWSAAALADLDRFVFFLRGRFPHLAAVVAREIITRSSVLMEHPFLGRPMDARDEYREVVLQVVNARYVFQYRVDGDRIVMLRVFHSREERE